MVPTRCSPNICTLCRTAPLTRCWHGAFQELEPVQPPMRYRHMSTFTVLWGKKKKYNKPETRRVNGHWFMAQEPKGTSTSWRRLQPFPFPSLCPNAQYTELAQCWLSTVTQSSSLLPIVVIAVKANAYLIFCKDF